MRATGLREPHPVAERGGEGVRQDWLPPAIPCEGSSLNAATPASSSAPTWSAGAAVEISTRARIASRTALRSSSRSSSAAADRDARVELADDQRRGLAQLVRAHRFGAARLAPPVRHALLPQAEPEPPGGLLDDRVAGEDELRAHLDDRAVREPPRPHPSADPVARLEHHDVVAGALQRVGGGQPREPGADDGDTAHGRVYSATCQIGPTRRRSAGSRPCARATASTATVRCA